MTFLNEKEVNSKKSESIDRQNNKFVLLLSLIQCHRCFRGKGKNTELKQTEQTKHALKFYLKKLG